MVNVAESWDYKSSQISKTLLKEHRESIDRLDAILIYTLGERFKHTQAVGKLKAEHNLPPADLNRELLGHHDQARWMV